MCMASRFHDTRSDPMWSFVFAVAYSGVKARVVSMQVSLSSEVMQMVKMVPRGFTATADAYLTPHIMRSASCLSSPNAWQPMM